MTLGAFTLFFTLVAIGIFCFRPQDGEARQLFTGLVSGFSGALLMYLKPEKPVPPVTKTNPPAANPASFEGGGL